MALYCYLKYVQSDTSEFSLSHWHSFLERAFNCSFQFTVSTVWPWVITSFSIHTEMKEYFFIYSEGIKERAANQRKLILSLFFLFMISPYIILLSHIWYPLLFLYLTIPPVDQFSNCRSCESMDEIKWKAEFPSFNVPTVYWDWSFGCTKRASSIHYCLKMIHWKFFLSPRLLF